MEKTDFLSVLIITLLLIICAGIGYTLYLVIPADEPIESDPDVSISPDYTIALDSVDTEYITVFVIKFNEKSSLTEEAFTFYKNGNKISVNILSWDGKNMICSIVTDAEHCGKTAYEGLEVKY